MAENEEPEQVPEEPPPAKLPRATVPTVLGPYGRDEDPITAPLDAASHWDERIWRRA